MDKCEKFDQLEQELEQYQNQDSSRDKIKLLGNQIDQMALDLENANDMLI